MPHPYRIARAISSLLILATSQVAHADPALFRSTIRIEPTLAQVKSLPEPKAEWRLQPALAARIGDALLAGKFPAEFSAAVTEALAIDPATGIGRITPTAQLLNLLPANKRLAWWATLATYDINRSYRWPISLSQQQIETLHTEPRFSEAVSRIRSWGVTEKTRILFADLFALEGAFPDEPTQLEFFQRLLGSNTEFLKQISDTSDPATIEAQARYWESESRNHEIDPFLSAIAHVSGHDRVDVAHLLPRLPRSLLYTYPPELEFAEEPSIENAALAAAFFTSTVDTQDALPNGFSAWLSEACAPVSGPRKFGDIIVFEDPQQTSWPFSMIYIADGVLLGRRPTLYSPWGFLHESQIQLLNPRLRGGETTVYRRNQITRSTQLPAPTSTPTYLSVLGNPQLQDLPPGPWGKLKFYNIHLAPSAALLSTIPEPSARPIWKFYDTSPSKARDTIAKIEMPASTREELLSLFSQARPDSKGIITVHPSTELVLATPPEVREKLFPLLIPGANATDYAQDFYFPTSLTPEEWFAPDTLSAEARQLALQLTYKHEDSLRLSDYGTFYHSIKNPADRPAAAQAIMRTPVVMVLMEKPSLAAVPQIADYWRIHQQKSILRLLESFAQSEDMAYLDITHLLPPLARELSNIYARASYDKPTPSCYWSALNFAADRPDPRLLVVPANPTKQEPLVWKKLRQEYSRVDQASQLGDILVYRSRADGAVLHLCAFIAADIVFTKNGFGSSSPWCLMRKEAVDSLYLKSDAELWVYTPKG